MKGTLLIVLASSTPLLSKTTAEYYKDKYSKDTDDPPKVMTCDNNVGCSGSTLCCSVSLCVGSSICLLGQKLHNDYCDHNFECMSKCCDKLDRKCSYFLTCYDKCTANAMCQAKCCSGGYCIH